MDPTEMENFNDPNDDEAQIMEEMEMQDPITAAAKQATFGSSDQQQISQQVIQEVHDEEAINLNEKNQIEASIYCVKQDRRTKRVIQQQESEESQRSQTAEEFSPINRVERPQTDDPGAHSSVNPSRRIQTAPHYNAGGSRRRVMNRRREQQQLHTSREAPAASVHQAFVESELMKAANIYQQFDKKGNLFENRLYAKTSINQAKLSKEQTAYDKKMESHPDEICRINNGSVTSPLDQQERTAYQNLLTQTQRSQADMMMKASASESAHNRSNNSQSVGNFKQNKSFTVMNYMMNSPKTDERVTDTATQYYQGFNFSRTGGLSRGGTFSRANGPKITSTSPYMKSKASLFQRVADENNQANKSQKLTANAKSASNISFMGVQKSIAKLKQLGTNSNCWSLKDQNPHYLVNGVGGKQNIFSKAQTLFTNDPSMYTNKEFNVTDRYADQVIQQQQKKRNSVQSNMINTFYYQSTEGYDAVDIDKQRDKVFSVSKTMNLDGRKLYSKQIDGKGSSKVSFSHRSEVLPTEAAGTKIQQKAYRANTQSRQIDGLYKEAKFSEKPSFLNHSRVDFNIIRPLENFKKHKPATAVSDTRQILSAMRQGKCHQVYGISDFNQNSRLAGIKYHEKYQKQYAKDPMSFRRNNGEFTNHVDSLKWCKFS